MRASRPRAARVTADSASTRDDAIVDENIAIMG